MAFDVRMVTDEPGDQQHPARALASATVKSEPAQFDRAGVIFVVVPSMVSARSWEVLKVPALKQIMQLSASDQSAASTCSSPTLPVIKSLNESAVSGLPDISGLPDMDIGPTIIHTTKSAAKTARAPVNQRQALQPKPAAKPSLPSHSSCMQPSSSAKPGHTNLSLMQSGLMQPVQQRQQQMLQHASMNQWDMMNLDFSLQGLPSQHHGCAKHGSVDWAITAQIGSDVPDSQLDAISPGALSIETTQRGSDYVSSPSAFSEEATQRESDFYYSDQCNDLSPRAFSVEPSGSGYWHDMSSVSSADMNHDMNHDMNRRGGEYSSGCMSSMSSHSSTRTASPEHPPSGSFGDSVFDGSTSFESPAGHYPYAAAWGHHSRQASAQLPTYSSLDAFSVWPRDRL
jgi:hypothetical protein